MIIIVGVSILALLGGVWLSGESQTPDSDVISRSGLHTHPKLEIYVKGERQDIPANIGVGPQYATKPAYNPGMKMTAMHTHEADGTIHLEFPGMATREDTKLKNFFAIWGKDMQSFGTNMTMTVNGAPNSELGEYEMKDGDKIEMRYDDMTI